MTHALWSDPVLPDATGSVLDAQPATTADLEHVVTLEMGLLDSHLLDGAALQARLHADFTELSPTGHVYDRDTIVHADGPDTTEGMRVDRLAAQEVAPGAVLVTYRSHRGDRQAWRSSLWLRTDRGWLLRHHQGTPIRGVYSA